MLYAGVDDVEKLQDHRTMTSEPPKAKGMADLLCEAEWMTSCVNDQHVVM